MEVHLESSAIECGDVFAKCDRIDEAQARVFRRTAATVEVGLGHCGRVVFGHFAPRPEGLLLVRVNLRVVIGPIFAFQCGVEERINRIAGVNDIADVPRARNNDDQSQRNG
jgi:hypothetical protein